MAEQQHGLGGVGDRAKVGGFASLPRAIFLLHRIERTTHAEISARLGVTQSVVESSIAHVLVNLVRIREGRPLRPCIYPEIDEAEAGLLYNFQAERGLWVQANKAERLGLSRSLRAWGGTTDFDAWLWYQGTTR